MYCILTYLYRYIIYCIIVFVLVVFLMNLQTSSKLLLHCNYLCVNDLHKLSIKYNVFMYIIRKYGL